MPLIGLVAVVEKAGDFRHHTWVDHAFEVFVERQFGIRNGENEVVEDRVALAIVGGDANGGRADVAGGGRAGECARAGVKGQPGGERRAVALVWRCK